MKLANQFQVNKLSLCNAGSVDVNSFFSVQLFFVVFLLKASLMERRVGVFHGIG